MNTRQIVIDCFKQVKAPTDDRHKHLINILEEKLNAEIEKERKKYFEEEIFEVLSDGVTMCFDDKRLVTPAYSTYNGENDFVVQSSYVDNPKGYKTFKNAYKSLTS